VTRFEFDLTIVPDGTGTGGTIVLRVVGQPGTRSWQYGYCNWRWYGYKTGNMPTLGEAEFNTLWRDASVIAQGDTNSGDVVKSSAGVELLRAIEEVLDGRTYVSPAITADPQGVFVARAGYLAATGRRAGGVTRPTPKPRCSSPRPAAR
jgi:hypothetical protein